MTHDLLGLFDRFTPRFVKKYAQFHADMATAFQQYVSEVESGKFPAKEHTVDMDDAEWDELLADLLEDVNQS